MYVIVFICFKLGKFNDINTANIHVHVGYRSVTQTKLLVMLVLCSIHEQLFLICYMLWLTGGTWVNALKFSPNLLLEL